MANVVLIVEDHPDMRLGLYRLINQLGHEAIAAATVSQGMEQLERNPSHVLLNLNLPDGDGTTVLRRIRSKNITPKVAIVSGTDDCALMDEARALNPDAVIQKTDYDSLVAWLTTE
jgi:DNA-binding NarL/FixJ family response regulator